MSHRLEVVTLARAEGANISELAVRHRVSRKTIYKWLRRFDPSDALSLADRARTPRTSPTRSSDVLEREVLDLRERHPAWGARKLRRRLLDLGKASPAASTITAILHRHDRISEEASAAATPWKRFEHARPNDLWQMDFKGHFALTDQRRCHPLSILDDHSRYALGLFACACEQGPLVRRHLQSTFRRYGLPREILCDNGPPWGVSHDGLAYTKLELWLLRLEIRVSHGRPYHPQTQGKDERLHRTLKAELITPGRFDCLKRTQEALDGWREIYNHQRPHEALALATPGSRYRMSSRSLPATLPTLRYEGCDEIRKVNAVGRLSFGGRSWQLGEAFAGQVVGLRAQNKSVYAVYFGRYRVGELDQQQREIRTVREKSAWHADKGLATLTQSRQARVTPV